MIDNRDLFAGIYLLARLMAYFDSDETDLDAESIAADAYDYADIMLAERSSRHES